MKRPRATSPPSITKPPLSPPATPILKQKLHRTGTTPKWFPLKLTQTELTLPLTFPTGQTFRWKQTGAIQYSGTIGPHLFSLRQRPGDDTVSYCVHCSSSPKSAELALLDFLNAEISLAELFSDFSKRDPRFGELAKHCFSLPSYLHKKLSCNRFPSPLNKLDKSAEDTETS